MCVYLHFVRLSKSVCLLYKSMIVYIHAHIYVCVSICVSVWMCVTRPPPKRHESSLLCVSLLWPVERGGPSQKICTSLKQQARQNKTHTDINNGRWKNNLRHQQKQDGGRTAEAPGAPAVKVSEPSGFKTGQEGESKWAKHWDTRISFPFFIKYVLTPRISVFLLF